MLRRNVADELVNMPKNVPVWILRTVVCVGVLIALATGAASAQTKQGVADTQASDSAYLPTLTFDVASIRESSVGSSFMVGGGFSSGSSSLKVTNFDVENLLSMAYGIRRDQMTGLPGWRSMFNIEAKADASADELLQKLNKKQVELERQHMMQKLLAERFQLRAHWETRTGLAYNLVVAKGGTKLQPAKNEPPTPEELKFTAGRSMPRLYQRGDSRTGFDFVAHGCSMDDLVGTLAGQFGHPVADKTGIPGTYDFILRYHGTLLSDRNADDLDPIPTLDVAIQQQLGLKLETIKAPVQILVIDHIEKPSPN
jgi:uncharacterized protein (TIGR03435 family)